MLQYNFQFMYIFTLFFSDGFIVSPWKLGHNLNPWGTGGFSRVPFQEWGLVKKVSILSKLSLYPKLQSLIKCIIAVQLQAYPRFPKSNLQLKVDNVSQDSREAMITHPFLVFLQKFPGDEMYLQLYLETWYFFCLVDTFLPIVDTSVQDKTKFHMWHLTWILW